APAARNESHMARPSPPEAPVMTAVRPLRSNMLFPPPSCSYQHILVFLQVRESPDHSFFNRALRPPTERFHLGRIQKDKRHIAYPASRLDAEFDSRTYSQVLRYPADRIAHFAIFIGAEIVNVDAFASGGDHAQYRVYAILHI